MSVKINLQKNPDQQEQRPPSLATLKTFPQNAGRKQVHPIEKVRLEQSENHPFPHPTEHIVKNKVVPYKNEPQMTVIAFKVDE